MEGVKAVNNRKKWDSVFNFTQHAQLILLVIILMLVSAVLVTIYSRTAEKSKNSRELTNAVQISRTTAEMYTSVKNLEKLLEETGGEYLSGEGVIYYSDELEPADKPDASYEVRLSEKSEDFLNALSITVKGADGEGTIYELNVSVYTGEEN